MTEQSTALVERGSVELSNQRFQNILELTERLEHMRDHVHLISPPPNVLSPGFVAIVSPPILIDTSYDRATGAGAEVYFQPSIHKSKRVGEDFEAIEVSLNANGLKRILAASGVRTAPSKRVDDGREPNYWVMQTDGEVLDFTGDMRPLPSGTVEIDFRDGSPQIGEWTPKEWAERVREADARFEAALKANKTKESERWKFKPTPINGWTGERVMNARRFGIRLAETKSLNALIRNLGIKQKYSIAELKAKPFLVVRAMFLPDMNDPEIKRMVTARQLGIIGQLYPQSSGHGVTLGMGDPTNVLPGHVSESIASPAPVEETKTAPPPEQTEEFTDEPAQQTKTADPVFYIARVLKTPTEPVQYFVEATRDGVAVTLFTTDRDIASACAKAAKDKLPRVIVTERISVQEKPYLQIVELSAISV